jgi:disulfide bond formation protein DsbB
MIAQMLYGVWNGILTRVFKVMFTQDPKLGSGGCSGIPIYGHVIWLNREPALDAIT